jgi:hypothetical protein
MQPHHFLFILFSLLCTCDLRAQQDSTVSAKVWRIELKDGFEAIGTILKEDSSQVVLLSISKITMQIPRTEIKVIKPLSGTVIQGEFRHSDPNYTRLFFAPTGRPLKSGQGYLSVYEIFFPFLAVGVADVLTLAGGMSLIPGAREQLFYLSPKLTPFHFAKTDLSVGLLYANTTGGDAAAIGVVYGVGTYGTADAAITAGAGWGFANGELSNRPVFVLGGELRVSRTVKLMTENWITSSSNLVTVILGVRFFGENLAADLGFLRPPKFESAGFPFIPWGGFTYNFGPK